MKFKELKEKKIEEIKTLLGEKYKALQESRFNQGGSKLKNVRETRNMKKDIARMLTRINQK